MASGARSPFLDIKSFTTDPTASSSPGPNPRTASPFLSVYEVGEEGTPDSGAQERQLFASDLHSEEMDEAIFEAVNEASEMYQQGAGERWDGERLLRQHFAALEREVNKAFDAASQRFARADLASLDSGELEAFFNEYTPDQELRPAFEHLFGGIFKAIKKVASKAVDLAKSGVVSLASMALGPLLNKLKPLVKPLLEKVLKFAIARLPESLRPIATQLAQRFGLASELESGEPEHEGLPLGMGEIQREFNRGMADALYARGEVERDLEVARAVTDSETPLRDPLADLDRAREELAGRLSNLKEGEDPGPAFENFIPLLLPVLGMGIKLVGRPRVISFLAGLLSPLLKRFVGPQYASALSNAIVDAGFHLLNLETAPGDASRAASGAVAATVEDTVRRVAALPEYMLEDQELLEGAALEAFEQAAAANLPPVLGEEIYRRRPDLRESAVARGVWVGMPHCYRPRYKKYSRVLRAHLTPEKAQAIETFGGASLAEFLEEQLGLAPGADMEANVHLYESVPGTMLPEMARLEANTPGLGSSAEASYGQIHPLTPEAAGTLLGEPGLGRPMSAESLSERYEIRPGQRFYHVCMPGVHPPMAVAGPGRLRRHSSLKIRLDFPAREIHLHLHLSETAAQKLLMKLRQQGHVGSIVAAMRPMLERKLEAALMPRVYRRVHIIHKRVPPRHSTGHALRHLPAELSSRLRFMLLRWTIEGLTEYFKNQTQQVLKAIESPKDGVTFRLTFHNPAVLDVLSRAFEGKTTAPDLASVPAGTPKTDVTVGPGYVHG